MATTSVTLSAKRKRAQVSYLDNDDEYLDELLGTQDELAEVAADDSDDDLSFRSTRSVQAIKKRKAVKKAKTSASAGSKSKKNVKPFPFLRLPAELRDQIYELALSDEDGITLVSVTKKYRRTVAPGPILEDNGRYYGSRSRRRHRARVQESQESSQGVPPRNKLSPNLLAVCKQVHAEGVGYLYQQPLILEDMYAMHSFVAAIGSHRTHVTDLTVKGWGQSRGTHKAMNFAGLTILAGCMNLKSLLLDCSIGWSRDPKGLARQIYRDGVYFLEAFGTANGAKDAAIEIVELNESNYDKTRGYWGRNQNALPEKDEFKEQVQVELRKLLGCK